MTNRFFGFPRVLIRRPHLASGLLSQCRALLPLFVLAACGEADIKPVAIVAEDMCAHCRMVISEKRYAAELIRQDGEPVKFDDIRCLIHYVEGKREKDRVAGYYVMDFDSQAWVKAEQALFLRSSAFKTPMGGGIVAFEKSRAQAVVARYEGELIGFANLFGEARSK
jgi:copper chaperone NosL